MRTKLIVFAFMVIVGCKDEPKANVSKEVMKIIRPFSICNPTKIDTTYNIQFGADPTLKSDFSGFGNESSLGTVNLVTGCEIDRSVYITIYFNPIINHSKI